MEILLAIVVASAVILFGALISIGNEQQRRAMDQLREQIVLWAIQDLRIKQHKLAHTTTVKDPVDWLTKLASKVSSNDLKLQIVEFFVTPPALHCITTTDSNVSVVFSTFSPEQVRSYYRVGNSSQLNTVERCPLISFSKKTEVYKLTTLNGGYMFEHELSVVWEAVTGGRGQQMDHIWMYIVE